MRGPLIATGAVVVAGAFLGWQRQSQVSAVAEDLGDLYRQAEQRGIPLKMKTSAARRKRVVTDREAASLVDEVAELLRQAESIERSGGNVDEALRDRMVDLSVQLMDLSPEHLRKVLGSLRANESITNATKSKIIGTAILYLSGEHPQEALRLLQQSKEVLGKGMMTEHAVTSALESWAKRDPAAALNWINSTEELPPGVVRKDLIFATLTGAAEGDPANAFRMLPSLGLNEYGEACEMIASAVAGSPEGRDSLIQGMREYLEQVNDPAVAEEVSSAVMMTLGEEISSGSFEEMSKWLEQKNFTNEELASFADGLSWFSTGKQTGEWLDWISQQVGGEKLADPVGNLMADWVEEDYIAAGKWLSGALEGPAREPAVMSYAEAVAAYDPEVAAQWAMTLKDDRARHRTLQAIYDNWPDEDQAGAERFAAQHGLE